MGNELELKEMLDFIYSYNVNSNRNNILLNQTVIAENYLKRLKTLDKKGYEKIIKDIENKLKIIINKNINPNIKLFFLLIFIFSSLIKFNLFLFSSIF